MIGLFQFGQTSVDDVLQGQLDFHCQNECDSKTGFSAKNSRLFHDKTETKGFLKKIFDFVEGCPLNNMSHISKSQSKLYC